ncbi:MAG: hypothetical protein CMP72_04590 [Flavobacteriales bacterium]|nr:hypothetical protein [Flavobacteriales bacterium]|tara:strand:+ start:269 stop:508 length:240 start_codon:yes stop_codon:yes gene_type:complete
MRKSLKHIFLLIITLLFISSCRSKKTFNGVEALKCTTFDDKKITNKKKKNSKYEIVVLKDGRRLGNKKRKRKTKNRLFK